MICIENANVVLESGILWNGMVLIENDRIADRGLRRTNGKSLGGCAGTGWN